jgi:hypothetical protein
MRALELMLGRAGLRTLALTPAIETARLGRGLVSARDGGG